MVYRHTIIEGLGRMTGLLLPAIGLQSGSNQSIIAMGLLKVYNISVLGMSSFELADSKGLPVN
jgi:hypothetical protein